MAGRHVLAAGEHLALAASREELLGVGAENHAVAGGWRFRREWAKMLVFKTSLFPCETRNERSESGFGGKKFRG